MARSLRVRPAGGRLEPDTGSATVELAAAIPLLVASPWRWSGSSAWRATRSSRKAPLARGPGRRQWAATRPGPRQPPGRPFHPAVRQGSPWRPPDPAGSESWSDCRSGCRSACGRSSSAPPRSPPSSPDHPRPPPAANETRGRPCRSGAPGHRRESIPTPARGAGWSDPDRVGTGRVRPAGRACRRRHRRVGRLEGGVADGGRHGGAGGVDSRGAGAVSAVGNGRGPSRRARSQGGRARCCQ